MLRRLVDFSLDHRPIVLALWFLLIAWGIHSALHLPIDAVPDITTVQVQVLTDSPGLAPEEVEQFVTFPVETALSGIPRREEIRSLSKFGLSVVTVIFEEDTDIYWARQQVSERLAEARESIPEGYGEPKLAPITTGLGEIYHFEVVGETRCAPGAPDTPECWSLMELRSILDWVVSPQLRAVPGVVEVNAFGGEVKTYQVTIDPERLVAYGLGVGDVVRAIRDNNLNTGGGYIPFGSEQYVVRAEGLLQSLDDLGRIAIDDRDAVPVYLRDVAELEFAPLLRQGAVTRDGDREAVAGIVLMLIGENSRTVARRVDSRVAEIARTLPDGVVIDTYYDRSDLVDRTLRTVAGNLVEGGLLVVVLLLLLIGSLRAGLLVATVIPLSMLVAFSAMRWAGVSGNLMSLGAIDFGLIVDGAVVVVDNILRRLRESREQDDPVPALEIVRAAVHQVARPVLFGVTIIILVYVPILALRGIEGKMFRPMALTVGFALAASLLCALTLVPVLASWILPKTRLKEPPLVQEAVLAFPGPGSRPPQDHLGSRRRGLRCQLGADPLSGGGADSYPRRRCNRHAYPAPTLDFAGSFKRGQPNGRENHFGSISRRGRNRSFSHRPTGSRARSHGSGDRGYFRNASSQGPLAFRFQGRARHGDSRRARSSSSGSEIRLHPAH